MPERLPAEAQVVFISVVFNRGASMGHDPDWSTAKEVDRRFEMRRMQADVKSADMFAIYAPSRHDEEIMEDCGAARLAPSALRRTMFVIVSPDYSIAYSQLTSVIMIG